MLCLCIYLLLLLSAKHVATKTRILITLLNVKTLHIQNLPEQKQKRWWHRIARKSQCLENLNHLVLGCPKELHLPQVVAVFMRIFVLVFGGKGPKLMHIYCIFTVKSGIVLKIHVSIFKYLVKFLIQKNLGYWIDHAFT